MLLTKKDSTEKLFKNILNASYREQQLPFVCKLADVMPLTKTDFSELLPLEISRHNAPNEDRFLWTLPSRN
jgi:hypothetical protein